MQYKRIRPRCGCAGYGKSRLYGGFDAVLAKIGGILFFQYFHVANDFVDVFFHDCNAALGVVPQDSFDNGPVLAVEDMHLFCCRGQVEDAGPHVVQIGVFYNMPDMGLAAAGIQETMHLVVAGKKAADMFCADTFRLFGQTVLQLLLP